MRDIMIADDFARLGTFRTVISVDRVPYVRTLENVLQFWRKVSDSIQKSKEMQKESIRSTGLKK